MQIKKAATNTPASVAGGVEATSKGFQSLSDLAPPLGAALTPVASSAVKRGLAGVGTAGPRTLRQIDADLARARTNIQRFEERVFDLRAYETSGYKELQENLNALEAERRAHLAASEVR